MPKRFENIFIRSKYKSYHRHSGNSLQYSYEYFKLFIQASWKKFHHPHWNYFNYILQNPSSNHSKIKFTRYHRISLSQFTIQNIGRQWRPRHRVPCLSAPPQQQHKYNNRQAHKSKSTYNWTEKCSKASSCRTFPDQNNRRLSIETAHCIINFHNFQPIQQSTYPRMAALLRRNDAYT